MLSAQENLVYQHGAIIRGDTTKKVIHLMFTGGDYNDGTDHIANVLHETGVNAHFFFTGDFYRNKTNEPVIQRLISAGNFVGAHSNRHLLYAAWENRDSLLVTKEEFTQDLLDNYVEMERFGLSPESSTLFMPPYEWYNDTISQWTSEMGLQLINFTPGTGSNADYTTPDMGRRYLSSDVIHERILSYEQNDPNGLNGFFLLLHVGTHPDRTDKYYLKLEVLINELRRRGYGFELFK